MGTKTEKLFYSPTRYMNIIGLYFNPRKFFRRVREREGGVSENRAHWGQVTIPNDLYLPFTVCPRVQPKLRERNGTKRNPIVRGEKRSTGTYWN